MGQGTTESVYQKVRSRSGDENNQLTDKISSQREGSAPEEDSDHTSESGAESLLFTRRGGRSRAPLLTFAKKHSSKTTAATFVIMRLGVCNERNDLPRARSEHEHLSRADCYQERNMAVPGGTFCRMPISPLAR